MDRKQFIWTIWRKGLRPILLIAILFFCLKFLYNVFTESGVERFAIILLLGLGVLYAIVYLMGQALKSIFTKINLMLPEGIKFWLGIMSKIFDYAAPIIAGMLLYHFWRENWKTAATMIGVLLIQRIREIIKGAKQTRTTD